MKTYEHPARKYWCETVPMAEAAGINPWECVRDALPGHYDTHPQFKGIPDRYTFALTVLEGRPVFVGDKVYGKHVGDWFNVSGNVDVLPDDCTWTPPTKKRTFMVELDANEIEQLQNVMLAIGTIGARITYDKLTAARDKE